MFHRLSRNENPLHVSLLLLLLFFFFLLFLLPTYTFCSTSAWEYWPPDSVLAPRQILSKIGFEKSIAKFIVLSPENNNHHVGRTMSKSSNTTTTALPPFLWIWLPRYYSEWKHHLQMALAPLSSSVVDDWPWRLVPWESHVKKESRPFNIQFQVASAASEPTSKQWTSDQLPSAHLE